MKVCLSLVIVALLQAATAQDQVTEPGFFEIVSALPGGDPAMLTLNGETMLESGLASGATTGGWSAPLGRHNLNLAWGEFEPIEITIEIEADATTLHVAFLDYRRNPDTGELEPQLELRHVEAQPGTEYRLAILSLARSPLLELTLNNRPYRAERFKLDHLDDWSGQSLWLREGERSVARFDFDEPGTYVLVLFQDLENQARAELVHLVEFESVGFDFEAETDRENPDDRGSAPDHDEVTTGFRAAGAAPKSFPA